MFFFCIEIIIPEETAISYTSIENVNSYLNSTELGILSNLKAELSTEDYNALNFNLALDTTTIKPNEPNESILSKSYEQCIPAKHVKISNG